MWTPAACAPLCIPSCYGPEANPIEWLWRVLRQAVTYNHQWEGLERLTGDLEERH